MDQIKVTIYNVFNSKPIRLNRMGTLTREWSMNSRTGVQATSSYSYAYVE